MNPINVLLSPPPPLRQQNNESAKGREKYKSTDYIPSPKTNDPTNNKKQQAKEHP